MISRGRFSPKSHSPGRHSPRMILLHVILRKTDFLNFSFQDILFLHMKYCNSPGRHSLWCNPSDFFLLAVIMFLSCLFFSMIFSRTSSSRWLLDRSTSKRFWPSSLQQLCSSPLSILRGGRPVVAAGKATSQLEKAGRPTSPPWRRNKISDRATSNLGAKSGLIIVFCHFFFTPHWWRVSQLCGTGSFIICNRKTVELYWMQNLHLVFFYPLSFR
jgi:hypothetical protein